VTGDSTRWGDPDGGSWSQCSFCRHWLGRKTCAAFPDGVPAAILDNEHDHREPFAGDNGIRFEAKPGREAAAAENWRRAIAPPVMLPPPYAKKR